MNLGEKIRNLREARGLTLQDIGDLWEISRSSVAGWEAGSSNPSIDKLPKLARALGVTVDQLLSDRPTLATPEQPAVDGIDPEVLVGIIGVLKELPRDGQQLALAQLQNIGSVLGAQAPRVIGNNRK